MSITQSHIWTDWTPHYKNCAKALWVDGPVPGRQKDEIAFKNGCQRSKIKLPTGQPKTPSRHSLFDNLLFFCVPPTASTATSQENPMTRQRLNRELASIDKWFSHRMINCTQSDNSWHTFYSIILFTKITIYLWCMKILTCCMYPLKKRLPCDRNTEINTKTEAGIAGC